MFWIALFFLDACLFVFLWHPSLGSSIRKVTKYKIIVLTLLLSGGLYGYYGSPFLSDHPFIRLEALSHPLLHNQRDDLENLIRTAQEKPLHSISWRNLANHYYHQHHYYESAIYYREAWRLDPNNLELKAFYTASLVLLNNGKLTSTSKELLNELKESGFPLCPELDFLRNLSPH